MKILLVSDTHGASIELISAYAEEMKADICIHAGDCGFYDNTSTDAMSQRELYLLVKHSALPEDEKETLLQGNAQEWKEAIVSRHLLGRFQDFLDDRMLKCLGYDKMSKLLYKCGESIMKRNPAFAVDLLDEEHEMMEGSEAPLPDELRQEYDFHKVRKKSPHHSSGFSR